MVSRKPSFIVLANLLAIFCAAGFCIRYLARYLPENQPNRLASEYSSYVRQASRQHIDWFPFSPAAFAKARSENRLIFLELGCSFSRDSNVLTKNHFNEPELAKLLNNHFVSIRTDIFEAPWLADQITLNQLTPLQSSGSLIVVLTDDGKVVDQTSFLPLYSRGKAVGLLDWLSDIARRWVRDPDTMRAESATKQLERDHQSKQVLSDDQLLDTDADSFSAGLAGALETDNGVLKSQVTPISAVIPGVLLDSDVASVWQTGARYLLKLRESPSYDQIHGGVFFTSTLPEFGSPHVGKVTGENALLAVEFARAGLEGLPLLTETAAQIVNWIRDTAQVQSGRLFQAGIESDEHPVTGSAYYSMPDSDQFGNALTEIVGSQPQVGDPIPSLKPSRDLKVGTGRDRTLAINQQVSILANAVKGRQRPKSDACVYADQNGQVISALYQLYVYLKDERLLSLAESARSEAMNTFVQPLGDCLHASAGLGRTTGYCGDYLWLARACIEAYAATADERSLNDARKIMSRCAELFQTDSAVYVSALSPLSSFAPFATACYPCADSSVQSLNSLAAANWIDLGKILNNESDISRGAKIIAAVRGNLPSLSWAASGLVRAESKLFNSFFVAKDVPVAELVKLRAMFPRTDFYKMSANSKYDAIRKPGYYLSELGRTSGPFTFAEVVQRESR